MDTSSDNTKPLGGSLGRRPPPPPPSPSSSVVDENAFVPVDNLPLAIVEGWFDEADADRDGRVADEEARAFFLRSGLAPTDLSTIWRIVKPPSAVAHQGKGLAKRKFSQALRLIAMAQNGFSLTPALATAALLPETWAAAGQSLLPPPQINSTQKQQEINLLDLDATGSGTPLPAQPDGPLPQGQMQPDSGQEALITGMEFLGIGQPTPTSSGPLGAGLLTSHSILENEEDLLSIQPSGQLQRPTFGAAMGARHQQRSLARSSLMKSERGSKHYVSTSPEPPLAYELRYPPLNPKESAKLGVLAAINGSLFAGTSVNGGLLQWLVPAGEAIDPELKSTKKTLRRLTSNSLRVTHEDRHAVPTEDADAAPCREVLATPRSKGAACLLTDEARSMLWVGDKDGWVSGYDMSTIRAHLGGAFDPEKCKICSFQAHRVGSISALCLAPTGELWTGSSRGSIRIWRFAKNNTGSSFKMGFTSGGDGDGLVGKARELRRPSGERAHSGPVVSIASTTDGQLMWTASRKGVALWDARTGAFLGALQRDSSGIAGGTAGSTGNIASSDPQSATGYAVDGRVSAATGLDVDSLNGSVLARPDAAEMDRWIAQQEGWAAQSDRGVAEFAERLSEGAGKAVKLMGKIGAKLGIGGGGSSSNSSNSAAAVMPSGQSPGDGLNGDDDAPVEQVSGGDVVSLVASPENQIWIAFRNGTLERYSAAGKLEVSRKFGGRVYSMALVGRRVWLGFTNGMVSVLAPDGTGLKAFLAHKAGIVSIAHAGIRTFTLAADGSINGWSSAIPCPSDEEALTAWHNQADSTYVRQSINVLAITWNCGESKPDADSSVFRWVHEHGYDKSLVVVGLQEVEMGGTSVALAAAKNALASKLQEKGNANAQFWSSAVLTALGGDRHWHQVALRQLSGMLVVAFARNNLRGHIGEVATASVACGVLGVGGNKGAVALEFTLHRQKFAVVCSHFAAHQNAVKARNANYAIIQKNLAFNRRGWLADDEDLQGGSTIVIPTPQHKRSNTLGGTSDYSTPVGSAGAAGSGGGLLSSSATAATVGAVAEDTDERNRLFGSDYVSSSEDEESDLDMASLADSAAAASTLSAVSAASSDDLLQGEGLRGAGALVWLGDFNYRIDGQYDQVKELAIRNELGPLLSCDQLRREMAAGRAFRGLREGPITFPPTYKFDKGVPSAAAYDSSEKRRIPAWCDRIFYRGSVPFPSPFPPENGEVEASFAGAPVEGEIRVNVREYGCWGDVYDSDHRPVYATLEVSLPVTNAAKKRELVGQLMHKYAPAALAVGADCDPEVALSHTSVKIHPIHMPDQMVLLSNNGIVGYSFAVLPSGDTGGGSSVEVRPQRGIVQPGSEAEIRVRASPGGAGSYASTPREVTVRVLVGPEYGQGGARVNGRGFCELQFTAVVLPEFSLDENL